MATRVAAFVALVAIASFCAVTPAAAQRISGALAGASIATSMEEGASCPTRVELRNAGAATWRAGAVSLGYQWRLPDGRIVQQITDAERLPQDVAPGSTVILCASVRAPERQGPLTLEWLLEGQPNGPTAQGVVGVFASEHANLVSVTPRRAAGSSMGTSVLAAWFLLPLRDGMLVELANVLPFLLAWVSAARIFRTVTGQSGVAWTPWFLLILFATPIVRGSLTMSADLFYMAAFLALNAILLDAALTSRLDAADVVPLAFSLGMLLGTKITGAVSAALLVAAYGAVAAAVCLTAKRRFNWPHPVWRRAAIAIVAVIASGGIWLVRNWWIYRSPLAPSSLSLFGITIFPGESFRDQMLHLSVLSDTRTITGYSPLSRFAYWIRTLVGPWFLPAGLAVVLLLIDGVLAVLRRQAFGPTASRKAVFAGVSLLLVVTHLLLLAASQWSSLEWTVGAALRYALPCFALYLLVAYTCCFAECVPWWRRFPFAGGCVLLVGTTIWYVVHQGSGNGPAQLTLPPLGLAALALVVAWFVVDGRRRLGVRVAAAAFAIIVVSGAAAAVVESRNRSLRQEADATFDRASVYIGSENEQVPESRRVLITILEDERAQHRSCTSRRFFVTTRWDTPLDLEGPQYENQVFSARGPALVPSVLDRMRAATEPCDYLVAWRSELATTRGVPLLNRARRLVPMRLVGDTEKFTIYAPGGIANSRR